MEAAGGTRSSIPDLSKAEVQRGNLQPPDCQPAGGPVHLFGPSIWPIVSAMLQIPAIMGICAHSLERLFALMM